MEEALLAVEDSLLQQARGTAVNLPRGHEIASPGVYIAHMQGALHEQGVVGFKVYTVAPQGYKFLVYLIIMDTGQLLAIIEANRLGQLRTGAATGVSVKHMARAGSRVAGVLGSGFQAGTQLEAVWRVADVDSAVVYSRNSPNRIAFAKRMSNQLGISVPAVDSAREVVDAADVLITITASGSPVFDGKWLRPGMHVAAVGGANEYVTELDDDAILRPEALVVDSLAQARKECGELLMPASRGLVLWEQVREL
jgi:ornithine cyclodeaminase/alanine dehydrogenase-like protein (mu-crystallin family)